MNKFLVLILILLFTNLALSEIFVISCECEKLTAKMVGSRDRECSGIENFEFDLNSNETIVKEDSITQTISTSSPYYFYGIMTYYPKLKSFVFRKGSGRIIDTVDYYKNCKEHN